MTDTDKILELRDSGMSMKKISKELEISYNKVREVINSEVSQFTNSPMIENEDSTLMPEVKQNKTPKIKKQIPKNKSLEILEKKKHAVYAPGISAIVR